MGLTCHRCGGDLHGDAIRGFCPVCGAPQLRLRADPTEGNGVAEDTTGTPPPPRQPQVVWPLALRYGASVAVLTGVIFVAAFAVPYFGLPSLLLLFGASFLVIGLYRRRSPAALMTPGIGARIGLSTGLLLSAVLSVTTAGTLLTARYRSHSMGSFDAQWAAQVQDLQVRMKATSPLPPETAHQMTTPEFRAGSMLAGLAALAVFLLVASAASGAFAGAIAVRPRTGP